MRFALIMACAAGVAAAEPPSISRLVPSAIAPDRSTEITLHGDDLDQVVSLWTSFDARCERLSASNGVAVFRIEPLTKTSAGLGMLRVIGSNGVSPLKFIMFDGFSTVASSKTNGSAAR